jgi:hypothetical protein
MFSNLSPSTAVALLLVAAGLILINRNRDTLSILETRFRATNPPEGLPAVECEIRLPLAEVSTPCVAQVSQEGLYLISTQEQITKPRWVINVPFLKQQIFIPWSELEYRRARFPMRNWFRFDLHNTKACFFVRQSVATELLRAANRPVPTLQS